MRARLLSLAALFSLVTAFAGLALPERAPAPGNANAGRLHDAADARTHVMVVAHRAGWKEKGVRVRAENSRMAMDAAAAGGVDMVELDVRRSADGILVVMHDATLERTTTCRGAVSARTLAELRACRLIVEDSGIVTDETVPTLAEMLEQARGRILVNIDNKLEPEDLIEIGALAQAMGMEREVLVKMAIWNDERLALARTIRTALPADMAFMPILADDAVRDPHFVEQVARLLDAPAAELVIWHRDGDAVPTADGGPLLSAEMREVAARRGMRLWINTYPITDRPEGMVAGGRGDGLAWQGGRPEEVYGFFTARGVSIIQTDEPRAVIGWLEENGLRRTTAPGY